MWLATLDVANVSAASQAVAMEARAIAGTRKHPASEAARVQVAYSAEASSHPTKPSKKIDRKQPPEVTRLLAEEFESSVGAPWSVNDCILRAPFDGEDAARMKSIRSVRAPESRWRFDDDDTVVATCQPTLRESDFVIVAPGPKTAVVRFACHRPRPVRRSCEKISAADPGTRTSIRDQHRGSDARNSGQHDRRNSYRGWRPRRRDENTPFVCGHSPHEGDVYIRERRDCTQEYHHVGRIQGDLFADPPLLPLPW